MTECPCEKCDTRKTIAYLTDCHFYGADCPYECKEYEEWKKWQEVTGDEL